MAEVEFLNLPPEIIVRIFSCLSVHETSNVSRVCKRFQELMLVEQIWEKRCQDDYNFWNLDGWNGSYREIYQHVLHKYGCLLNIRTFSSDLQPYGGVFVIKLEAGRMEVLEVMAPPDPFVERPVSLQQQFTISYEPRTAAPCILCHQGPSQPHPAEAQVVSEGRCVIFTCSHQDLHRPLTEDMQAFRDWVALQTCMDAQEVLAGSLQHRELLYQKFFKKWQHGMNLRLSCLQLPEPAVAEVGCARPILPGLYKGTYGGHGVEIILMDYVLEPTGKTLLTGTKMTGDPNVPARESTLYVDLERPMVLTEDQQRSVALLRDIDIPDVAPNLLAAGLPPQPFCVPVGCFARSTGYPRSCIARYHGEGQIAETNFRHPSRTAGHFVVFSESSFGFLWLYLHSFSLYSRVDPAQL